MPPPKPDFAVLPVIEPPDRDTTPPTEATAPPSVAELPERVSLTKETEPPASKTAPPIPAWLPDMVTPLNAAEALLVTRATAPPAPALPPESVRLTATKVTPVVPEPLTLTTP